MKFHPDAVKEQRSIHAVYTGRINHRAPFGKDFDYKPELSAVY
jgi:hypothetical protein